MDGHYDEFAEEHGGAGSFMWCKPQTVSDDSIEPA